MCGLYIVNLYSLDNGDAIKLNKFKQQSKYPNMEYYIPVGDREVVLNFFILIGGAIGGACAGGLSAWTATIASDNKMSTGKRVGICVAIWLVASVLEFILAVVLGMMMSGI